MSIKILGGMAKGFDVIAPHNSLTRPTSVLLKRRLFDSIQYFEGIQFFDLCAGSGSIGLEAASRGASSVHFIEMNPKVFSVLTSNIKKFTTRAPQSKIETSKLDLSRFYKIYKKAMDSNLEQFIFFDPPYEKISLYEGFFQFINEIEYTGRFVIEACRQKTMREDAFEEKFGKAQKLIRQGTSYFLVYDNR